MAFGSRSEKGVTHQLRISTLLAPRSSPLFSLLSLLARNRDAVEGIPRKLFLEPPGTLTCLAGRN
jgi:hypothetical protein